MTDHDSDRRVVLWKVVKVSSAATWLHLFEAMSGSGPTAMGNRDFEVEAWPDGLLISGAMDGNRWVAWGDVTEIGPPPPSVADGDGVWVEIVLNEGEPVRLGRQHLVSAGEESIAEAADKVERLRAARTAWWTGTWPPG